MLCRERLEAGKNSYPVSRSIFDEAIPWGSLYFLRLARPEASPFGITENNSGRGCRAVHSKTA
jgi:hypothetical protein